MLSDLRQKVSWLYYGTRTYDDLDSESKDTVDEIVNDGYQRFLNPPIAPGQRRVHRWNFLRPYLSISTVASQEDYNLAEDFGGLDGPLAYARSDNKWFRLTKTDPHKILAQRQRDTLSATSYPTEYAIVTNYPDGHASPSSVLMLWPMPDGAYTLKGRYFVMAAPLSEEQPYPVCPALHSQCLVESVLSVAEERLEDSSGLHGQLFLQRLQTSVDLDREQFSPDHLALDIDRTDAMSVGRDHTVEGDYVSYNGYTPGA